jgi:hypothetical protein
MFALIFEKNVFVFSYQLWSREGLLLLKNSREKDTVIAMVGLYNVFTVRRQMLQIHQTGYAQLRPELEKSPKSAYAKSGEKSLGQYTLQCR